jgi:UDPglucose--hexose-1-phosphate uridylyltransferase
MAAVREQRWHPLPAEWVIVAAHRQNRPWTGGTVAAPAASAAELKALPAIHHAAAGR